MLFRAIDDLADVDQCVLLTVSEDQMRAASIASMTMRLVGLSSASRIRIGRSGALMAGAASSAAPSAIRRRAVKRKRLPPSGGHSTAMAPPMRPVRWRDIARPRPVPPKRREIELSAWTDQSDLPTGVPVVVTKVIGPDSVEVVAAAAG